MAQLRLVASRNLNGRSRNTKLRSVRCRMLPAASSDWPSVARKARQLHERRPSAAAVIERLVDDLLDEAWEC